MVQLSKLDTVAGAAQAHKIVKDQTTAGDSSSTKTKQTRKQYSNSELVVISILNPLLKSLKPIYRVSVPTAMQFRKAVATKAAVEGDYPTIVPDR